MLANPVSLSYSRSLRRVGNSKRKRGAMIYIVIPRELADRYYEEFKRRYQDVEGVEVIIDRRKGERRRDQSAGGKRALRDRRRRRAAGSLLDV